MNQYFGKEYALGFGLLIVPAIAGAILISVTICSPVDSHGVRKLAPIGLLLAAISCFLIGLWVIVYITAIYEEPYIKIPRREESHYEDDMYEDDYTTEKSPPKRDYYRQSKGSYILWNTLFTFVNGGLFLCLFFLI